MAVSIIPFIIVQLPKVFKFPSGQRVAILVALIVAIVLLLSYCLFQVILNLYILSNLISLVLFIWNICSCIDSHGLLCKDTMASLSCYMYFPNIIILITL